MSRAASEAVDFAAHAASSFLILVVAHFLGAFLSPGAAIFTAWTFGLIREFTEWQDGGRHPFTKWGLLDQAGWIAGGIAFAVIVL